MKVVQATNIIGELVAFWFLRIPLWRHTFDFDVHHIAMRHEDAPSKGWPGSIIISRDVDDGYCGTSAPGKDQITF